MLMLVSVFILTSPGVVDNGVGVHVTMVLVQVLCLYFCSRSARL